MEAQREKQARFFPTIPVPKFLSFMGTTSRTGVHVPVGVVPVLSLEPSGGGRDLRVRVRGPLPRAPERGECVTVHLTRFEQYQGFQVKTRPLSDSPDRAALYEQDGDDLVVHGSHIFTVHHSPYTMRFFELVPYEEVQQIVGGLHYALVAVGEQANISPRFVYHTDFHGDRLTLYHGDGLALKTYMNLKSNRQVSRLVVDLDEYSGYVLRGTNEEFQPHQHPDAYEKICQGFRAGSWGKPSRVFRFSVESWDAIAPTARSPKRPA